MFTGIVEVVGEVRAVTHGATASRIEVHAPAILEGVVIGDSIAMDGCCVTVASLREDAFAVDLMSETLAATTLGGLGVGDRVNLERALAMGDRLGGHLVQGHVDAVATVDAVEDLPGTRLVTLCLPAGLERYVSVKGSLCVDGVSLTVARVGDEGRVTIGLIPHTRAVTTLEDLEGGSRVNIEVDVLAKHVERLLAAGGAVAAPTEDTA
jgi:riboflavin synthase